MGDNDDKKVPVHVALISGAFAGIGVDITLFPLDTLKTRLQSKEGFVKSGGFSRLWAGIGPVAIGKFNDNNVHCNFNVYLDIYFRISSFCSSLFCDLRNWEKSRFS